MLPFHGGTLNFILTNLGLPLFGPTHTIHLPIYRGVQPNFTCMSLDHLKYSHVFH